ncbi:hypothetical protein F751_3894 [Auxenochlorella protothecoides]|uniref:Uncharacterized protein n=1 Tax=Auxenochlorella protothecoides TaxID=3075 RepID=A0A087SD74_AUXPR|nr:hypothetical protein F751_3894 [Auxenochlorella protothecoides]KFM23678.1 hypothetical protein F751_3894 [Auxenochlorella protothecoides]
MGEADVIIRRKEDLSDTCYNSRPCQNTGRSSREPPACIPPAAHLLVCVLMGWAAGLGGRAAGGFVEVLDAYCACGVSRETRDPALAQPTAACPYAEEHGSPPHEALGIVMAPITGESARYVGVHVVNRKHSALMLTRVGLCEHALFTMRVNVHTTVRVSCGRAAVPHRCCGTLLSKQSPPPGSGRRQSLCT